MSAAPPVLAVRTFLPFCRTLLSGQRPPAPPDRLPLRKPDALTAEVVSGIADMANKTVTRWLFRELGWRQRAIIDPEDDEETLTARLWEPAAWGGLRLRFTDEAVDVLLGLWNLHADPTQKRITERLSGTQRRKLGRLWDNQATRDKMLASHRAKWHDADLGALRRLSLSANGDLLLSHIAERSFVRAGAELSGGTGNPLSQLAWGHLHHTDLDRIDRLFDDDLLPLMPWISAAWPDGWRQRWGWSVRTPELAQQTFTAQAARWGRWVSRAVAAGRGDLLVPFIEGYVDQLRRQADSQRGLESRLEGTRHADRQALWDAWADALEPLLQINRAWKQAHGRHPVDREAADKLLLAGAAEWDLPHWASRAATTIASLRGEIG